MIKASGFRWNSWSGKRPLKQKRRTKRSKYPKDLRVCGSRNLPRKLQVCCPDCIVDRNAHPNTQSGITYFWLHYALPCIWSPLRVFFFCSRRASNPGRGTGRTRTKIIQQRWLSRPRKEEGKIFIPISFTIAFSWSSTPSLQTQLFSLSLSLTWQT